MNAAFVDLGAGKNGFLTQTICPSFSWSPHRGSVLSGTALMVQLEKEQIGSRARMTGKITLPGRFVVLMPRENHLGISRQITNPEERERLRAIAESIKPPEMGLIVRTVAEGCDAELLVDDMHFVLEEWQHLQELFQKLPAPALLYQNSLVYRVLRDLVTENVSQIIVDRPELFRTVADGLASLSKQPSVQVELYKGRVNLFDHLGLTKQLEKHRTKEFGWTAAAIW